MTNLITNANARTAIQKIKEVTDVAILTECLKVETGKDAPRSTVIGALQMRIDIIKDAGEADVEIEPEAVVETPEPEPTPEPVAVEPEAEPAPVIETPEPTEADNCAVAFFGALKAGDAGLAAVMIAEVRREGADDAEMADALIKAFASVVTTKPARKAGKPKGASSRVVARLQAAMDAAGTQDDGTVIIDKAAMDAAGWSTVWFKYENEWSRGKSGRAALGSRGVAAEKLGFTSELTDANTPQAVVTLTPIAAEPVA